jgi:ABC-type transporter Mla subunit MlaD
MVWVLLGSLVLASLVLLIVWATRWGDLSHAQPKTAVTAKEAASFHAPQRSGG